MRIVQLTAGDEATAGAGAELARAQGCYGMWVGTEPGDEAAIAAYRAAGSGGPEPFVTLGWKLTSAGARAGGP